MQTRHRQPNRSLSRAVSRVEKGPVVTNQSLEPLRLLFPCFLFLHSRLVCGQNVFSPIMIRSVSRLWLALAVLLALGGGSHLPIASTCILVNAAGSTDNADPSAKGPVIGELMAETGFYQSMTLSSDVEQPLYHTRSKYQDISIVKTEYYGKVLILDGVVQLTERDADSYNEMMAHIAMMAVTEPKRVLVVGGGDGYVLSEVSLFYDNALVGHPF